MSSVFAADAARDLEQIVEANGQQFGAIHDSVAALPRAAGKWSRKQILGHLIDSAANNHQRFVRLRTAPKIDLPGYEQNAWVEANGYDARDWSALIELWSAYNRQLAEVLKRLPAEALQNTWTTPGGKQVTLEWIITDYLDHIHHHIDQILAPI